LEFKFLLYYIQALNVCVSSSFAEVF